MIYLDYIFLAIIAFFTIKGLMKGLIQEVFGFLGIIISVVLATRLMSDASGWIGNFIKVNPVMGSVLGFLLVFFASILLLQALSHFLQKVVQYSFLGWVEKVFGGAVGFIKGALICSLVVLLISAVPFISNLLPELNQSKLLPPLRQFVPTVFNFVNHAAPDSKSFYAELKESIDNFEIADLQDEYSDFLKLMDKDNLKDEKESEKK